MATKAKKPAGQVELRRWCIEMAVRWPTYERAAAYPNQQVGGIQQYVQHVPGGHCDEDVIGRASKIFTWVNTP